MQDPNPIFTKKNKVPLATETGEVTGKTWRPKKEESEALLRIMHRYEQEMLPAQAQFHDEWDQAKKIYEAYITTDPLKESFKIPISHTVIDAALAEEIDAFPDLSLSTQDEDDQQKLPILEGAKKYALLRTNWEKIKLEALRLRRIYGFAAVRIYYSREMRMTKQRVPVKGDSGITLGYEEVLDYPWDDIRFEVIDSPRRFLIGDNDKDIDEAADCCLITDVDWDAFRQRVQHDIRYKNTEFVKMGWDFGMDIKGEIVLPTQEATRTQQKRVRLVEYWNKYRDEYVMIANGVVIRQTCLVDDHKELPFAVLHMYRRPHTFYSKGIPKLLESIEAAYNAVIQAEVRATKLAFPILVTDDDNAIDPRQIAPYPGVVLEGGLDRVDLKQLGSVPNEVYRLKDKLEEWIIWLTGINIKQIFDQNASSQQRVGIEALKKESMLARVNANLRENESNFIVRLGNLLMQDIMQYFPTPKIRRLAPNEDVASLSKMTLKKQGKQLFTDLKTKNTAVLEMRRIPMEKRLKEKVTGDGKSYSLMYDGDGPGSFIFARPEYIRCHSKLDIHAIRPSAMGSSKEAKKLTLIELSDHAVAVNQAAMQMGGTPAEKDPTTGQEITPAKPGEPIWNQEWIEEQLALAHDFPLDKAISSKSEAPKNNPVDTINKITSQIQQIGQRKPPPFQQFLAARGVTPGQPQGQAGGGQAQSPQGQSQQQPFQMSQNEQQQFSQYSG